MIETTATDAGGPAAPGAAAAPGGGKRTERPPLDYSILIPARDEADNIGPLLTEIAAAFEARRFEIIVIDDGSSDETAAVVRRQAGAPAAASLRLVRHDRSGGKSAAIRSGALRAAGEILITMDADGQNDPAFLAALVAPLAGDPRVGLVAGERTARHDGLAKKLASRLANRLRRSLLGDSTRDTACGLKAIRREVYLALPFFDNNHRFFPALVLREGYEVRHVPVRDRPRLHGRSKYGVLDRALVGLPDLIGVWWLRRRRRTRPTAHEEEF